MCNFISSVEKRSVLLHLYIIILLEKNYRNINLSVKDTIVGLFSGIYDYLEFNSPLWFLPCFFITCVIYNILYNKTNKIATYVISAILYITYAVLQPILSLPFSINRMIELIIFYAVGNIMAGRKFDEALSRLSLLFKIIILIACFTFSCIISFLKLYHGILLLLCGLAGIISLMLLSILLGKFTLLAHTGRMTLLIMLIHGPIYRVLTKITAMLMSCGTDYVRGNLILSFVLSLITISVSAVAYIILSKIAPWSIGIKTNNKLSRTTT